VVGAIAVARPDVRPFTDKQIALLQTFADQAVIAIENVRLFTELQEKNQALTQAHAQVTEALDQQTATAEILRVISSSPTDVQPVFDTIAQSAMRLCDGNFGNVATYDGELLHLVAHANVTAEGVELTKQMFPMRPSRATVLGRVVVDKAVVHIPDAQRDVEYLQALGVALRGRSAIGVPISREGEVVGSIAVGRSVPRPFTENEITLLKTFADQAVIAIENVRLFNETKEALDQQTATSEVLRVIASSPTELQPVLDAMAESVARLCGVYDAVIWRLEGDGLRPVAHHGPVGSLGDRVVPVHRGTVTGRTVLDRQTVQVTDLQAEVDEFPEGSAFARQFGHRSIVSVPLLREGVAIGVMSLRRAEVQPFTEKQIDLLKTFADQAVIAIENVRLFKELESRNRDLTTALDQRTATAEILRVISSSPTNVQPTFEAIAESATRLCGAVNGLVFRFDGELIHVAAHHNIGGAELDAILSVFPIRPGRGSIAGRAIESRRIVHVEDLGQDPEYEQTRVVQAGFRTALSVPMLRGGVPIGTINVMRMAVAPFSPSQIALLQTFADQAVIAIENVRLFTETKEALEQQTATSEILKVISSSPTDEKPVFDAIAGNARRLLEGHTVSVARLVGDELRLMAFNTTDAAADAILQAFFPIRAASIALVERVMHERTPVIVTDMETDSAIPESLRELSRARGWRSVIWMPMVREDTAIGMIAVSRRAPGGFADGELALLKIFADQAVIAIENVRLFKELQEKNEALTQAHAQVTEALEQQTATSEILRTITHSQTDVQPVFDTMVHSAVRLLRGYSGTLTRVAGGQIELAAFTSTGADADAALRASYPRSLESEGTLVMAIRERVPLNVATAQTDPRLPQIQRTFARVRGFQSLAAVPLLRHDEAVGAILVTRREPGGFTDEEIGLLKTFADQAVIAIENARLLRELQARTQELTRSVEQLTALGDVGRAVSSTLDLETVLTTIVARAVELSGLDGGVVFEYDEATEEFIQRVATETGGALAEVRRTTRFRKGEGVLGRTAITLEPVQVPDITVPGAYESRLRENLIASGIRAILAVPMVREDRLIGCLAVTRNHPGEFPSGTIELLRTFATQSALAIQNARLFREIEEKSRQLEAASQHKSEFLANMSHELRTPLNAIIGFSEVLSERMFGELNEKQDEYLKDIYASGTHLLSLINDILDLSKIEAGRMELELTDFHLPTALDSALTLVRERAGRRGIALQMNVDSRLGQIQADERKVRQVVLNLLSNAIKFTPEGGRIEVSATPKDGSVEVSVSDTGVGIAPEDQEAVFEEFRQVGTAAKKVEGTGLGLTLCRKFVELHGGRIWVKSQIGVGSTFTFTIPVRHGE
jgi:GAF domain-containing protein